MAGVNSSTRPRRRIAGRLAPAVLVSLLAVAGCAPETGPADPQSPLASDQRSIEASTGEGAGSGAVDQPEQEPTAPDAEPSASTEAEAAVGGVTAALVELAAGSPSPTRGEMVNAFVDAGIAEDAVEVSLDVTPTGLEVDAIQAASPVGATCVVGQIRDGSAVVSLLPVLASGLCFVGDQR